MAAAVKHLDKSAGVQITDKNWPDAFAGATQAAEKFFVENAGDRDLLALELRIGPVGTNDGSTMLRTGADTATVIAPYGVAAALSGAGAGGVWSGTGVKFYRITAVNALGETTGSVEVSVNVDDVTKKVTLTWNTVVAATGYRIYRTTTAGSYPTPSLRTTIASGSTNTFVDDGAATTTGALPTTNTTGGAAPNYGTAPALGTGSLAIGTLKIGQQFVYWVNRVVPGGTAESGNPRLATIDFVET